jgi:thiamine-phosphate pyrophosphorylase
VFVTTSKAGLPDPLGTDTLARVAEAVEIPVIAIAGITVERVPEVLAAGAHGVAVIGAIASASDPGAQTRRFLRMLEDIPSGRRP